MGVGPGYRQHTMANATATTAGRAGAAAARRPSEAEVEAMAAAIAAAERRERLRRAEEEREAAHRSDRRRQQCLLICAGFFLASCLLLATLMHGLREAPVVSEPEAHAVVASSGDLGPGIDASGTTCRDLGGNVEWVKLDDQWVRP